MVAGLSRIDYTLVGEAQVNQLPRLRYIIFCSAAKADAAHSPHRAGHAKQLVHVCAVRI